MDQNLSKSTRITPKNSPYRISMPETVFLTDNRDLMDTLTDQRTSRLVEENKALRNMTQRLCSKLKPHLKETDSIQHDLHKMDKTQNTMEKDVLIERLKSKVFSLKTLKAESDRKMVEVQEENQQIQEAINAERNEMELEKTKRARDLKEMQAQFDCVHQQNEGLREWMAEIKRKNLEILQNTSTDRDILRNKVQTLESEKLDFDRALNAVKTELSVSNGQVLKLKEQCSEYKQRDQEQQEDIYKLLQQMASLKNERSQEHQEAAKERDQSVQEMTAKYQKLQVLYDNLVRESSNEDGPASQAVRARMMDRIALLEKEVAAKCKEIEDVSFAKRNLEDENLKMKMEHGNALKEVYNKLSAQEQLKIIEIQSEHNKSKSTTTVNQSMHQDQRLLIKRAGVESRERLALQRKVNSLSTKHAKERMEKNKLINELQSKIKSLEILRDEMQMNIQELNAKQRAEKMEKLMGIRRTTQRNAKEEDQLRERVSTLEAKNKALKHENASLSDQLRDSERFVADRQVTSITVATREHEKIRHLQQENESLQNMFSERTKIDSRVIAELMRGGKDLGCRLEHCHKQIKMLRNVAQRSKQHTAKQQWERAGIQSYADDMERVQKQYNMLVQQSESERQQMMNTKETLMIRNQRLQQQLDGQRGISNGKREFIKRMKTAAQAAVMLLGQLRSMREHCQNEVEMWNKKCMELQSQWTQFEGERSQKVREINVLSREKDTALENERQKVVELQRAKERQKEIQREIQIDYWDQMRLIRVDMTKLIHLLEEERQKNLELIQSRKSEVETQQVQEQEEEVVFWDSKEAANEKSDIVTQSSDLFYV